MLTPPLWEDRFPRSTRPGPIGLEAAPHYPPVRAASSTTASQAAPSVPARSAIRDGLAHLSGATMTNDADLMPDLGQEDAFEVQMRGYSRRQVDEFVARARSQIRDLEGRLSRSVDDTERARLELSTARQDLSDKRPARRSASGSARSSSSPRTRPRRSGYAPRTRSASSATMPRRKRNGTAPRPASRPSEC